MGLGSNFCDWAWNQICLDFCAHLILCGTLKGTGRIEALKKSGHTLYTSVGSISAFYYTKPQIYCWLLWQWEGLISEVPLTRQGTKCSFSTVPFLGLIPLQASKVQHKVGLFFMYATQPMLLLCYLYGHKLAVWFDIIEVHRPILGGCQKLNSGLSILVCCTLMLLQLCTLSMVG